MSVQTATFETTGEASWGLRHRTLHLGATLTAFAALFAIAPSAPLVAIMVVALSLGLATASVLRVIRADSDGLSMTPSTAEMLAGATLVACMIWLASAVIDAVAPIDPSAMTLFFLVVGVAVTFGAIVLVETVFSALACFMIKRAAATGAIGAEVAVMLNQQQKWAISLDGLDR